MGVVFTAGLDTPEIAELAMARLRSIGSLNRTADTLGISQQMLSGILRGPLGDERGYRLAKDDMEVARLAETGIECRNGCGPVFGHRLCPNCGKRARKGVDDA
jgi:hypothetical protein